VLFRSGDPETEDPEGPFPQKRKPCMWAAAVSFAPLYVCISGCPKYVSLPGYTGILGQAQVT
jgi:hypothetical protein